jgi:hypothetical protein
LLKRKEGRKRKVVGDLYLLAGKLTEAEKEYNEAISNCKIWSDGIWQASAMEGIAIARTVERWRKTDGSVSLKKKIREPDFKIKRCIFRPRARLLLIVYHSNLEHLHHLKQTSSETSQNVFSSSLLSTPDTSRSLQPHFHQPQLHGKLLLELWKPVIL